MLVCRRLAFLPIVFLAAAAALAGCSIFGGKEPPPRPTFSPTGQPLIPPQYPQKCEDALDIWFDALDPAHSGKMTRDVLLADAKVQYQRMDMRHDGKVTAEELSRYRMQAMGGHYLSVSTPGQYSNVGRGRNDDEDRPGDRIDSGYENEGRRDKDDKKEIDAFAALTTDQADPVMSADTDMNGSVSWEEFQTSIIQDFAHFDKDHEGFITKSEVETMCGPSGKSWF
jgi:EF hand